MSQSNEDLTIAVCDLYEKAMLQLRMFLSFGPSLIALVETMRERDPEFSAVYARLYEDAKKLPQFQALPQLIEIASQAVQRIKAREVN